MAVKIRLSRGGAKKRPYYRIVVADARMPRDGRYLERVGIYNPMLPKDSDERLKLVEDRIKYWLSQGAQPTARVAIFLGKAGLIDMPAQSNNPNKGKPSEKTLMRVQEKEEKRQAAKEAADAAAEEAKEAAKAAKAEAAAAAEEAKEAAKAAKAEAAAAPAEEPVAEEVPKAEDAAKE